MTLPLLHSPADVLRKLMVDMGLGASPPGSPWPVYCASEPDRPDECLTAYDTAPKPDGRMMIDGETVNHFGLQVRVRSKDHPAGFAKAEALRRTFDGKVFNAAVALGGAMYTVFALCGSRVMYIGKDAPSTRRSLFTINCTAAVRRDA